MSTAMDPPPPDNLDVYTLIDGSTDGVGDEGDDEEERDDQDGDHSSLGNRPERPRRNGAPKLPQFSHENSMLQTACDWLLSLIKPPKAATPTELRRHAIGLSVAVALIYGILAIAHGWASAVGLSGFARADTVSVLQAESAESRITLFSMGIREYHLLRCNTTNYPDQVLVNDRIEDLRAKYEKAVGAPYVLPDCPTKPQ